VRHVPRIEGSSSTDRRTTDHAIQAQLQQVIGATAYDHDGDKLGNIRPIYYDEDTAQPKWITVHTGLFRRLEWASHQREKSPVGSREVPVAGRGAGIRGPKTADDKTADERTVR
jgi:hypothetical protein